MKCRPTSPPQTPPDWAARARAAFKVGDPLEDEPWRMLGEYLYHAALEGA